MENDGRVRSSTLQYFALDGLPREDCFEQLMPTATPWQRRLCCCAASLVALAIIAVIFMASYSAISNSSTPTTVPTISTTVPSPTSTVHIESTTRDGNFEITTTEVNLNKTTRGEEDGTTTEAEESIKKGMAKENLTHNVNNEFIKKHKTSKKPIKSSDEYHSEENYNKGGVEEMPEYYNRPATNKMYSKKTNKINKINTQTLESSNEHDLIDNLDGKNKFISNSEENENTLNTTISKNKHKSIKNKLDSQVENKIKNTSSEDQNAYNTPTKINDKLNSFTSNDLSESSNENKNDEYKSLSMYSNENNDTKKESKKLHKMSKKTFKSIEVTEESQTQNILNEDKNIETPKGNKDDFNSVLHKKISKKNKDALEYYESSDEINFDDNKNKKIYSEADDDNLNTTTSKKQQKISKRLFKFTESPIKNNEENNMKENQDFGTSSEENKNYSNEVSSQNLNKIDANSFQSIFSSIEQSEDVSSVSTPQEGKTKWKTSVSKKQRKLDKNLNKTLQATDEYSTDENQNISATSEETEHISDKTLHNKPSIFNKQSVKSMEFFHIDEDDSSNYTPYINKDELDKTISKKQRKMDKQLLYENLQSSDENNNDNTYVKSDKTTNDYEDILSKISNKKKSKKLMESSKENSNENIYNEDKSTYNYYLTNEENENSLSTKVSKKQRKPIKNEVKTNDITPYVSKLRK
uniref:Uncharacterized protein n=1 Tax=Clastoptera arizonana TaxID=38151 RepID=A0A1B6CD39_9HEMI